LTSDTDLSADAPIEPLTPNALAAHALSAFERVVASTPGFRLRSGQQEMARQVAQTLSLADLGECPAPTKAIAVIQAGTGVG